MICLLHEDGSKTKKKIFYGKLIINHRSKKHNFPQISIVYSHMSHAWHIKTLIEWVWGIFMLPPLHLLEEESSKFSLPLYKREYNHTPFYVFLNQILR